MLEGRNLAVMRGEQVLFAQLDISVGASEVVRLLGPNGSGKTTLLRVLCGLTEADEGEVYWQGNEVTRSRAEFNDALLFLGHKPGLTPELSARENLTLLSGLESYKTDCPTEESTQSATGKAIERALVEVGLGTRIDQPLATLSAGQQQRVKLARLQLTVAPLWILDEPLTALDSSGQAWLAERITEHASEGGSVLVTTHQEFGNSNWLSVSLDDFPRSGSDD